MSALNPPSLSLRIALLALAALTGVPDTATMAAAGELPAIASRQRAEKKSFTDSEIVEGFLKTAFGAEYHLAGRVDRIRKFDGPVRVFAESDRADRKTQLAKVVADIGTRVQHLDIAMAGSSEAANVRVKLVRDRDLFRTISSFYGAEKAREIRTSLDPQCLSGFRKNDNFEIEHSDVILTVDNGDFTFLDCAYEELLQSLGPINDTTSVPWTMFNDNVSMGYFDVYDQYILNLLYDPRIKRRHDRAGGQGGAARRAHRRARLGEAGERSEGVRDSYLSPPHTFLAFVIRNCWRITLWPASKYSEISASNSARKLLSLSGSSLYWATSLIKGPIVDSMVRRKCCGLSADGVIMSISKERSFAFPARRSATIFGSPHNTGDATPSGGGRWRPIIANIRPTYRCGGQVENAMVPPGFSTRSISPMATSGRGANMWPNWLSTTSNSLSP
ncbi:hypothetical protein AB7M42_001766 [Bradyrhizobium diazoefficiens]